MRTVGARQAVEATRSGEAAGDGAGQGAAPLALAHTDWLYHRLTVTGPADGVAAFREGAAGAGVIPWRLDLDRMEEDWVHRLLAPPRRLGLAGARVLARQLRDAVALRHDAATGLVGHGRACRLDLHALVPVPDAMLRLGPDHPDALAWLWARWGTTAALRHVAAAPPPRLRQPLPAGTAAWRLRFWSADWTPWRALAQVATAWPDLRFDIQPDYDGP